MNDNDFMELSKQILQQGSTLRIKAGGTSMLPSIKDRETLLIVPADESSVSVGDVVLRLNGNSMQVHRVVKKSKSKAHEKVLLTKGDGLLVFDLPARKGDILGKVIEVEKPYGIIKMGSNTWKPINYLIAMYSSVTGRICQKLNSIRERSSWKSIVVHFFGKVIHFSIFTGFILLVQPFLYLLKIKSRFC